LKNLALFLSLFFACLCQSCKDESICTDDITCRVNAGFYVRDGNGERDTLLDGVTLYGKLRPDSLIYENAQGLGNIKFPLPNSMEEHSDFILTVDTISDTLKLWHRSRLEMVSFECGFTVTHDIYWTSHMNMIIDTISITDPLVRLTDEQNIKIYIKPAAVPDSAK
jgi:hypothetical protein